MMEHGYVKCPMCGTIHPYNQDCPQCAHNRAHDKAAFTIDWLVTVLKAAFCLILLICLGFMVVAAIRSCGG